MNFGNGTNQTFGFNDRLQMTNQTLSRGAETLQKYDYNYGELNSNGVLKNTGKLEQIVSHIGTVKQWTQKFKYDSIGRLSESEEKRGDTNAVTYKQKFDFDRFGNLYRKTASNPTSGQEQPLLYTPIEDADIEKTTNRFTTPTGTTYNEAGQVVTDNKFRTMSFGYDANGRMVKATKASFPDALTVYDTLGNRVATKVDDVWQFTIYDAFGKLVAEYGGLTPSDEGGVKYVLQDWQGSVRGVLSNAGFVQSRTDYQAFGEEIQSGVGLRTSAQGFGSAINNRQGYGLTEKDDSTGLNHTWFRKNENRAGRWTSPDPYNGSMSLGNPQSFNRYSYVESQPTNFVDPSGLFIRHCYWDYYAEIIIIDEDGVISYTPPSRVWVCVDSNIGNGITGFPPTGGNPDGGGGNSPNGDELLAPACALAAFYFGLWSICIYVATNDTTCNPLLQEAAYWLAACNGKDPDNPQLPEPKPETTSANRIKTQATIINAISNSKPSYSGSSKKSGSIVGSVTVNNIRVNGRSCGIA